MIRSGPSFFWPRAARTLLAASVAGALSACGLTGGHAPVENRLPGRTAPVRLVDPATLPGAEFAGKPGYYTVQPGDTIRSISRALNVDWRDLAQWNSAWVANPDTIEVGQVLRVVPLAGVAPASAPASAVAPVRPAAPTPASAAAPPSTTAGAAWRRPVCGAAPVAAAPREAARRRPVKPRVGSARPAGCARRYLACSGRGAPAGAVVEQQGGMSIGDQRQ